MPFPLNYLSNPAATISPADAQRLLNARNSYNFPGARIVWAPQAPGGAIPNQVMIGGRRAMFCPPGPGAQTNIALDRYHHMLLTSLNSCDRLLGLASVVYWGYFTFSDPYARNKVDWLLSGNAGKPGVSCAAAMRAIDLALDDLRVPDSGLALSRLSQLSGLGQTPFASKVIAFLSPSTSGIYDKWISKGLATANWALCPTPRDIRSGVGQVSQPGIQRKYQNWCFFLERVQTELNRFGWLWQNTETTPQQWRAIDVERALFQVYKNQAQIQMPAKTPSTGTQQGATMNIKVKTACKTIARGDVFSYSGDPSTGTDIFFGAQPHCVHVTSKDYAFIINQFVTRQVVIGASHTSPPAGSLGEWLIRNLPGRPVITSYVAAILVDTGWAVKVNSHAIKFL